MTWGKGIIIFFVITFCLFSQPVSAQKEQVYQYKAEVFLVELQVSVTDKEGNFVEGLKPEDFIIIDEGKQQEISHFDYIVHNKANIDLIARSSPAKRRQFLLLFDLSFATTKGLMNAHRAGLDFIDMILPTDLVAVATFSPYQGLKLLVNFTNDKRQIREVISSLGLIKASHLISDPNNYNFESLQQTLKGGSEDSGGSILALSEVQLQANEILHELLALMKNTDAQTYKLHVANFIDQLNTMGQALNAIKGRKTIIYFSEGFDGKVLTGKTLRELDKDIDLFIQGRFADIDSGTRFGDAGIRLQMEKMLKRFVGSNCVIQAIDVGGLRDWGKGNEGFDEKQTGQTTLHIMASFTGGVLYKNMNDLTKALDDILQSSSTYYVIGYYPKDVGKKGKFRKIKVKINRHGLKVAVRKGYYEDKPYKKYTALEKKIRLAEIIIKNIINNDIQFDALLSSFPGEKNIARVPIFLQLPGKQFLDKEGKKPTKLEMYSYLIDDKGYFKDFFFGHFKIDVKKSEQKLESNGLKFYDMLLAPPGKHKVKLIVQNGDTGEVGTKICSITVPDYQSKELAITPPIFVDNDMGWIMTRGYDPNNPKGKKEGLPVSYPFTLGKEEFIPAVTPELRLGQPAQFCLKIYNLMLHPEAKMPQTKMNFEIIYPDGSSSKIEKIALVNKPSLGEDNCFELMFQFILEKIPPGEYKFKVTVADYLAGKQVESSTPFILKS